MKQEEARYLVSQTFTHSFSEEQFTEFVRNLLPGMQQASTRTIPNAQLPQGFREHVHSYTRIGTYHDPKGDVLDVVVVKLKRQDSLDRARTRQRNLMAHYLKGRSKDAVLVAYIGDDTSDWRFSFVKLAYETEITESGKVKVNTEFTPARRYSFLVGEHEPNHTAQKQLGDLLMKEGKLTLAQIEEAFNIESVTKEFFEDYKSLFLEIKENLDQILLSNTNVKAEFERCEINTSNYAKKLLGQIVFLYILQKKGWLGIDKDVAWGTGDKKFLSNLFEKNRNKNFFNDVLEPFFYEALAIERKGDYYPSLECKVPFLNGGLFEPLNGYDWDNLHIQLNNKIFEKVFEVFNLYNFTVREDEPLEKEVAVDPEMLGKVFENLLEVSDRKSKGAFYTPREIVHYMCQESLIYYLDTTLNRESKKVSKEDIESLIHTGDIYLENDLAKEEGRKSGEYGLPESIREFAHEIDFALAEVKICDPAIGSGAFPVGMMVEIVKVRSVLTPYLSNQRNRDAYTFKWHCIENNLYGVDIDAGAVEIAKLRLWLSLVVDEDCYNHIRPLPNLDYRIVCGNSLLSVQKDLFNYALYPELEKKKIQYFSITSSKNKSVLRIEIEDLINQLTDDKKSFDVEVYFSEVFSSKQGFDLVIGNPPYLGEAGNKEVFREIKTSKLGKYYQRKMDLFYFFFHFALDNSNSNAHIALITTNYFTTATKASILRSEIKTKSFIRNLINFNELRVFESALGQHNLITIIGKNKKSDYKAQTIVVQRKGLGEPRILSLILEGKDDESSYYEVSQENIFDGLENYIRLQGVSTDGENITLSILDKITNCKMRLGSLCNINQGLLSGVDRITNLHVNKEIVGPDKLGNGVYVLSNHEINNLKLNISEYKLVKPYFKNSDIEQYYCKNKPDKFILYLTRDLDIEKFPNILNHVNFYKKVIDNRSRDRGEMQAALRLGKWWVIFAARDEKIFLSEKIVCPQRSDKNTFGYNDISWYAGTDIYFITKRNSNVNLKYILAILNSSLYYFWFYHRGKRKGNNLELLYQPLTEVPIPNMDPPTTKRIIGMVDKILSLRNMTSIKKEAGRKSFMQEIDRTIYSYFRLSEEEISIIEESIGR